MTVAMTGLEFVTQDSVDRDVQPKSEFSPDWLNIHPHSSIKLRGKSGAVRGCFAGHVYTFE